MTDLEKYLKLGISDSPIPKEVWEALTKLPTEPVDKVDEWDITLNQLVNDMGNLDTYIVCDLKDAGIPKAYEFKFSSDYRPRAFLHPKYAFAKVAYCEVVDATTMKVYLKMEEEQE